MYKAEVRGPLILGNKNYRQITSDIIAPIDNPTPGWWKVALAISLTMASFGIFALYYTVRYGLGTWAVNNSVAWGWEIINFVWWIGIGHAGTAFSIFLLILRQKWRTSINRAAEAMTVFAVGCAAIFPAIHMGRVWLAFYIFPYPNTRGPLWVNFNSPLFWDFIAISAYLLISASFWYFGMVPDFASIRDRAKTKAKKAILRFPRFWLDRFNQRMAALRRFKLCSWRYCCCSCSFCSLHCINRLCQFSNSRMALNLISSLFRSRSYFFRFWYGYDVDDRNPQILSPRRLCY